MEPTNELTPTVRKFTLYVYCIQYTHVLMDAINCYQTVGMNLKLFFASISAWK